MPQNVLSNDQFHNLLFQHSPSHIWVRDLEGKYWAANPSYLEFLSMPLDTVIGKTNFDIFPHKFAKEANTDDDLVIKGKTSNVKETKIFYKENEFTFIVLKFPLFDEKRGVYAIAGFSVDINKEKKILNVLEQKENLLVSIVNSMSDGLMFFDSEERVKIINEEAKKILSSISKLKSIKEIYTRLQFFSLHNNKQLIADKKLPWTLALKGKEVIDQEFEVIDLKDNDMRQINISSMPVHNHKKELLGATVIFKDITKRNMLYREMERQAKELMQKNEALEQFSYFVTHDLREPLRTISSFTHILEKELSQHENLDLSIKKYLSFIQEGTQTINRMIIDLLKFCEKNDPNTATLVSLEKCLKRAIDFLMVLVKENKAKIHCIPLPLVEGNETSLVLLFQNLITNAIKYRREENPEIFITLKTTGDSYIIGVKDNGIGLESKHFREIFLPFKRVSTNSQAKGSGIGLSLCKKILQEHEGKIWVESKLGEGSHFKFKLKRERVSGSLLKQETKKKVA